MVKYAGCNSFASLIFYRNPHLLTVSQPSNCTTSRHWNDTRGSGELARRNTRLFHLPALKTNTPYSASPPPSPCLLPHLAFAPEDFPLMNATTSACIRANPDISGVGIRFSIYGQVLLNVIFALIFPPNNTIPMEYSPLATSSRNLYLTGCALLICAFYQGSMQGLTVHHTLIILNLNWIIYLSALLHLLIQSCQAIPQRRQTVNSAIPLRRPTLEGPRTGPTAVDHARSVWQLALLPAGHLSAMGFLGILLWTQVQTFGAQPECTPLTSLVVFGSSYSVLDETIRSSSVAIYWIVAIPLLNVVVTSATAFIAPAGAALAIWTAERGTGRSLVPWSVFASCSGIATISVLLVLFISNTEMMIARGVQTSLVGTGEEEWTYGQTLALVTLLVQMVEMVKAFSYLKAQRDRGRRA